MKVTLVPPVAPPPTVVLEMTQDEARTLLSIAYTSISVPRAVKEYRGHLVSHDDVYRLLRSLQNSLEPVLR